MHVLKESSSVHAKSIARTIGTHACIKVLLFILFLECVAFSLSKEVFQV